MNTQLQTEAVPLVTPESLVEVLGVVYVHKKTSDGGDMYLTRFGLPFVDLLEVDNWYDPEWFRTHGIPLEGTSSVYRIRTKEKQGCGLELVVKNSRVGEDVPVDTKTLLEFLNTEFNSPWEEFALVMEMREGKYGPPDITIQTQEPLAIYVPPEKMQMWQSGRSQERINRLKKRHPDIDIDILRQYKMIYGWIKGKNAVEVSEHIGLRGEALSRHLETLTRKVITDLEHKGYVVADMKPDHIIIREHDVGRLERIQGPDPDDARQRKAAFLKEMVDGGQYAVVDYELLMRTPPHMETVAQARRHAYLDDQSTRFIATPLPSLAYASGLARAKHQSTRFIATPLPSHLEAVEILGVPYIHGHVESTGGQLWVVGRNARLFDYFLPERWRKTHAWRLSMHNEVFYTVTKDNIHIVWKTSRVGEKPPVNLRDPKSAKILKRGYNSPFEAFAVAHDLSTRGIPVVYTRAIYMTGSKKSEVTEDRSRFESHRMLLNSDGSPILREDRHYITLRGYYNGSDTWVAKQTGALCRPMNLVQAVVNGIISHADFVRLYYRVRRRVEEAGYDGSLIGGNDLLLAVAPNGDVIREPDGTPEVRICSFELIYPLVCEASD